jgi:hypothetical protein
MSNPKSQIPNPNALPNANPQRTPTFPVQIPKPSSWDLDVHGALGFGSWELGMRWDLGFGAWDLIYSSLRTTIGSTLAARFAGMRQATVATTAMKTATEAIVAGSVGFTLNSWA